MADRSSNWAVFTDRSSSLVSTNNIFMQQDDENRDRNKKRFICSPCIKGCIVGSLLCGIGLAVLIALLLTPISAKTNSTSISTTIKSTSSITTPSTVSSTSAPTTTSTTNSTSSSSSSTTSITSGINLHWNQTGIPVAGTNTSKFSSPRCLYIDLNDTMYVCAHTARSVEAWFENATNGTRVTDDNGLHADFVTVDKNGFLYITEHIGNMVRRYPPGSTNHTIVAGGGSASNPLNKLNNPLGLDVDDDLNIYVADEGTNRVIQWAYNTLNGTVVIDLNTFNSSSSLSGLLLAYNSSNQVYLSDEYTDSVYLWTFGATTPDVTLTQVRNSTNLNTPSSLVFDQYGNLYVGENTSNGRIIMYSVNSTIGEVIIAGSGGSSSAKVGIAFDTNFNLYALLGDGTVMKYTHI